MTTALVCVVTVTVILILASLVRTLRTAPTGSSDFDLDYRPVTDLTEAEAEARLDRLARQIGTAMSLNQIRSEGVPMPGRCYSLLLSMARDDSWSSSLFPRTSRNLAGQLQPNGRLGLNSCAA